MSHILNCIKSNGMLFMRDSDKIKWDTTSEYTGVVKTEVPILMSNKLASK